jgi:hypothetical protein
VEPLRDGLLTVVALLAAVWLGEGAAGWVDRFFAPLEPAAEPPSEPSPSSPPGKPEVEAALSGRPASRKSRRARGKRRKARDSAPSSEPTRARDRSLWTSALTAAGVFVGVILFRNWLGLETREALLGGLAVGGVILVRRLFRRAFQRPVPASREDPWGGAGSASLSAPLRPSPTLAGAVAAVVGTVLVFDLLGERCLGLNTPQALLTGLAMGLAARASGRILYAVKRFFEARYTGSLLPGYGGLLDHLGSLFLALPAAYYCLRWLL